MVSLTGLAVVNCVKTTCMVCEWSSCSYRMHRHIGAMGISNTTGRLTLVVSNCNKYNVINLAALNNLKVLDFVVQSQCTVATTTTLLYLPPRLTTLKITKCSRSNIMILPHAGVPIVVAAASILIKCVVFFGTIIESVKTSVQPLSVVNKTGKFCKVVGCKNSNCSKHL